MPLKKNLVEFSALARAGIASLRNVVNEPELTAWLESVAAERLGPARPAAEEAEPTKPTKAREWLAKVARKHQLREGLSEEVGPDLGGASAPSSWGGLPWVRKALAEQRPLSRLVLPHEEREKIASVLDWLRSDEGPPASGDWTRISFDQAVKAEHGWIEAKAKAFAKTQQDQEAGQGTTPFLDLSSLGASWEGWRWVKVESALALDREGALMKHCVGSYAEDVAEGRKEIYSLRDPQNKPKLTIEAVGPKLAQLKGFANAACPAEQREAVGAFAMEFERVADKAGLGSVKLSPDMERAGFASLPSVGVFHPESGLSPEQRARWEGRLSGLAKVNEKGRDVECKELISFLAKTGLARELSELLPLVDPKAKHSEALCDASREGHKEIVEMLLPWSDPLALSSGALRWASREGHKEIVEMLLPLSDPLAGDSAALRWASYAGHKEIVEMLLPVSDTKTDGSEALCCAASGGHGEIVEMLLPLSDPLAMDSQALRYAASNGHREIVEMLLPLSDPLAEDSEALREAATYGHKDIVEILLPWSDPKARDSQALCSAARAGHKEIVQMLLPWSAPKALDSFALCSAASAGHREIVQMLAHSYRGDEDTFHRLLKESGMDSSGFHVSTPCSGGEVQPMVESMVDKIVGRRQKNLPKELARELLGRAHRA